MLVVVKLSFIDVARVYMHVTRKERHIYGQHETIYSCLSFFIPGICNVTFHNDLRGLLREPLAKFKAPETIPFYQERYSPSPQLHKQP